MTADAPDYTAYVVFGDETYQYAFNEDTIRIFGVESAEEAAERLCPRKDPAGVIIA